MIDSIPQRTNKARMVLLSCPRSALSRFGHFRGRPGRRGRVTATVSRVTSRSGTFALANEQLGGENKTARYQLRFGEGVAVAPWRPLDSHSLRSGGGAILSPTVRLGGSSLALSSEPTTA